MTSGSMKIHVEINVYTVYIEMGDMPNTLQEKKCHICPNIDE